MHVFQKMNALGAQGQPFLFILDFDLKKPLIFTPSVFNAADSPVLFSLNGAHNLFRAPSSNQRGNLPHLVFEKYPIRFDRYREAFQYVQGQILEGNSFLVNLTQPTNIHTNLTLDSIFWESRATYKLLLKNRFVVFSPETFVTISSDGVLSTCPMKGTIDATLPHAEARLLHDEKEMAEHHTIVDLMRNDLNYVGRNAQVERFRYVDRIETHRGTILQTSTQISCQLPNGFQMHLGDIFHGLLPAGSISGAPKAKTIEIIKTAEGYERGYYTGVVGFFDGQEVVSGVMIRFIENINGQLVFKSGGGITAYSDAHTEYQELIDKIYVPIVGNHPVSPR